jgi:hypothetical protein
VGEALRGRTRPAQGPQGGPGKAGPGPARRPGNGPQGGRAKAIQALPYGPCLAVEGPQGDPPGQGPQRGGPRPARRPAGPGPAKRRAKARKETRRARARMEARRRHPGPAGRPEGDTGRRPGQGPEGGMKGGERRPGTERRWATPRRPDTPGRGGADAAPSAPAGHERARAAASRERANRSRG